MDWVSIVLIVIFFLLPLLQQVLEQRRRGEMPVPGHGEESEGAEREWNEPVAHSPVKGETREQRDDSPPSWSEGWTPWPTPPEEHEDHDEEESRGPAVRAPAQLEGRPVAQPVDREHSVPAAPPHTQAPHAPAPSQALPEPVGAPAPSFSNRPPGARRSDLFHELRTRAGLRHAVLLKEVLGPPKSLRSDAEEVRF